MNLDSSGIRLDTLTEFMPKLKKTVTTINKWKIIFRFRIIINLNLKLKLDYQGYIEY